MTKEERAQFDESVLTYVQVHNGWSFDWILRNIEIPDTMKKDPDFWRHLDRSLQRLRKKGKIVYRKHTSTTKAGWYPVEEKAS